MEKQFDAILKRVAKNVKSARKNAGLSQEDMRDYGLDIRHFRRLESGNHWPSLYSLAKIASVLNVDIKEFFK